MSGKKYLWLDGTTHSEPDPNWTEQEAIKRGLVPARGAEKSSVVASQRNPNFVHEVMLNSMGSLAWDRSGLEGQ